MYLQVSDSHLITTLGCWDLQLNSVAVELEVDDALESDATEGCLADADRQMDRSVGGRVASLSASRG